MKWPPPHALSRFAPPATAWSSRASRRSWVTLLRERQNADPVLPRARTRRTLTTRGAVEVAIQDGARIVHSTACSLERDLALFAERAATAGVHAQGVTVDDMLLTLLPSHRRPRQLRAPLAARRARAVGDDSEVLAIIGIETGV